MAKILLYNQKCSVCNRLLFYSIVLFVFNVNATTFYVNDNFTEKDIYTTAVGNDANVGTSPDKPKLSVLSAYESANENDTIVIDVGNYSDLSIEGELLFKNTKNINFIIARLSDNIYSRIPLPVNEKVSPAAFYINNDKPIEREAYSRSLQNAVEKE